ncbi:hypothetical protein [Ruminococcus sp. NK3A76]|uniref:hypothetical protein n=1 Tax=Ruminococcus sp. NK3A76 TaxID=877411 RepID=UPI00048ABEB6|nr:hypothetical protein [Ruminococcus sp. NK3A76]
MKKRYCIITQTLLLLWFFLDMTGVYFSNSYLVTRSYKDDGLFFLIYLVAMILFIFKEKIGKWAVWVWTSLWFVIQFLCHEWYTIFSKGVMGSLEDKIKYFSGAIKWIEIDGRYIPDVYHTILHILILAVVITTALYIRNSKKRV